MATLKYNEDDEPICKNCGKPLNEDDDLDMDSGYCSEKCHLESIYTEEDEDEV